MADGGAPVGQQITDYAQQVADINRQISALPRGDGGLLPDDKDTYGRLKAQRDAISDKAQALSDRAKKVGAAPIDFGTEVKKASSASKEPPLVPEVKTDEGVKVGQPGDNHDTVQPNAPEKDRGFVDPAAPNKVLSREAAATQAPQADVNGDGKLTSEEINTTAGLPARKEAGPTSKIAEFRAKTGEAYADLDDATLAEKLHAKFYSDMPREQFDAKMGIAPAPPKPDTVKEGSFLGIPIKRTIPGDTTGGKTIDKPMIDATKYMLGSEKPGAGETLERGLNVLGGMGAGGTGLARQVAGAAGSGLKKAGSAIADVVKDATGSTARKASSGLRGEISERAGAAASTEEQAAQQAAQRAEELKGQQQQLQAQQPGVAAQRAEAATAPPKQGQTAGLEGERVVAKTREQVAALEKQYVEAGVAKEEAGKLAETHQAHVEDATAAVDQLDKDLLAKPGTTADEFGGQLRSVTEQIHEKYSAARAEQSGYGKALEAAGDELRVDTTGTRSLIDSHLKDIRNPALQSVLNRTKDLLTTEKGDVAHEGLTLKSAESLRKFLDGVVQSKMFGDQAVDRETLYVVKQIKNDLVKSMNGYEPYAEASRKWAELSRPLDIVERKGALKKVLDTDPLSTDYALTEAQVVGQAIAKARSGSPTLARLVEENPSLRFPARLYFTQDLFGKEAVPTVASLRTWLKTNEQPLKQLGLYDEFRDIRVAKETAQKAVEEAKGAAKETMAQARVAERQEQQVRQQLAAAQKVREKAKGRVEAAQKGKPTAEDLMAQSGKRAEAGSKRLESRQGEAVKTKEKAEGAADTYRQFETEIKTAVDKAVPTKTRAFITKLRRDGKIDDEAYGQLLEKVNAVEEANLKSKEMRKRLLVVGFIGGASAGAPYVWRKALDLIP